MNWKAIATNDPKKIKSWFLSNSKKENNVGIATGRKSAASGQYLICIDVDASEHPITKQLHRDHPTFFYRTGGGGYHFWYWSSIPIKNSVSLIANKVDVRGTNGYIVVPPSKHVSGGSYGFISPDALTTKIASIPEFLLQRIRDAAREKIKQPIVPVVSKTNKTKKTIAQVLANTGWSGLSVADIRRKMMQGQTKVPEGIRNVVMHRLLSSDRARGAISRSCLEVSAKSYLKLFFQNPGTFSDVELSKIIDSCMKYAAYNTSHENVNSSYVSWLKDRKIKVTKEQIVKLNAVDAQFFASAILPSPTSRIPLSLIINERARFFKNEGKMERFSVYRPQLMAKKLESLGYRRIRTNKGNLWNVEFQVQIPVTPCYNENMSTPEEIVKLNADAIVEVVNGTPVPTVVSATAVTEPAPAIPVAVEAVTPAAEEETQYIKNEKTGEKYRVIKHKTQTKRKEHPHDHLFQNRAGYDWGRSMTEHLAELDPEVDTEALANEELVQDREAVLAFIESVQNGDIIGVKYNRYKVVGKVEEGIYVDGECDAEGVPPLLTMGTLDFGRWLGFMEILWRDEKPYNVSEFEDYTVKILVPVNEDGTDKIPANTPAPPTAEEIKAAATAVATATAPTASTTLDQQLDAVKAAKKVLKDLQKKVKAMTTPAAPVLVPVRRSRGISNAPATVPASPAALKKADAKAAKIRATKKSK